MQTIRHGGAKQTEDTLALASSDVSRNIGTIGATLSLVQDGVIGGAAALADGVRIYVEGADIRYGIGTVTTSLGEIAGNGDIILLQSRHEIENYEFISAVAGVPATLKTTTQYFSVHGDKIMEIHRNPHTFHKDHDIGGHRIIDEQ